MPAEVAAVVSLGEERRLPVIAALDDVLGNPSEDESGSACHGGKSRNSFQIPPSTPTVGKSYTDPIYSAATHCNCLGKHTVFRS